MDPDFVHIANLQEGDDDALAQLMTLHKDALFRYILRYVGNDADAADLTEETFVRVYFNAAKYRKKAKVKTWIYSIATNLCRDWHRRNQRRLKHHVQWNEEPNDTAALIERQPDQNPSVQSQAETRELDRHLREALAQLPAKLKEAFILSVLEERPHKESAELLGASSKTIETRIYRARKMLKQSLSSYMKR